MSTCTRKKTNKTNKQTNKQTQTNNAIYVELSDGEKEARKPTRSGQTALRLID